MASQSLAIAAKLLCKLHVSPEHEWKDSLNARIEEVQQAFKNIPQMLRFSPSSVSLDGIGVYAAESLPKGTQYRGICMQHVAA